VGERARKGCGSCCLGCFVVAGVLGIVVGVIGLMYGPRLLAWLVEEAPGRVLEVVEDQVVERSAEPQAFPPVPPATEPPEATRQRFQAQLQPGPEAPEAPRVLEVPQDDLNRLLTSGLQQGGLSDLVHGAHVELLAGSARLRATLRGPALARSLPPEPDPRLAGSLGPEGYRRLKDILARSQYLNLQLTLAARGGALELTGANLLGLDLPVASVAAALAEAWSRRTGGEASGSTFSLPGVRSLELTPALARVRLAPDDTAGNSAAP
jgi:hypothetical protein